MLEPLKLMSVAHAEETTLDLPQRAERVRFCSRCGTTPDLPEGGPTHFGQERVCGHCGMGVLLSCPPEALAGDGEPFLVVNRELRVSAVSEAGEAIFGPEAGVLDSALMSSLTSPLGDELLERAVARAATGAREVVSLPVRASAADARRYGTLEARIACCGPPRAALLVLDAVGELGG